MKPDRRRQPPATRAIQWIVPLGLLGLAGCRQYEREPLDLEAHRASFEQRALGGENMEAFLERLRQQAGAAPAVFSFDDGLSCEEGEVVALFHNADLRLARSNANIALARAEHAGLWEDPEFGFDGAEIVSPSAPFQLGLMLNLTIPVSGRLEVERARADAEHEVELRRIIDAEWSTRLRVRERWARWSLAMERVRLLTEVIEQVESINTLTQRLESAGELSRIESRLFRVELAERRAALTDAQRTTHLLHIDLLELMGLPADAGIRLIAGEPTMTIPDVDDPLARLIAANTELAVGRAEYEVAEQALRLEIRKQYPDITIGGGYGSEDDDDRLLLGVSLPIPVLNANRGGIAEAHARRSHARASAEATFEKLSRAHARWTASLDAARRQQDQYTSEILPLLEEQSGEIDRIAALGEVNTLLLLETVSREFDAKSRLLELRGAEHESLVNVVRLLGPDHANAAVTGRVSEPVAGG